MIIMNISYLCYSETKVMVLQAEKWEEFTIATLCSWPTWSVFSLVACFVTEDWPGGGWLPVPSRITAFKVLNVVTRTFSGSDLVESWTIREEVLGDWSPIVSTRFLPTASSGFFELGNLENKKLAESFRDRTNFNNCRYNSYLTLI